MWRGQSSQHSGRPDFTLESCRVTPLDSAIPLTILSYLPGSQDLTIDGKLDGKLILSKIQVPRSQ